MVPRSYKAVLILLLAVCSGEYCLTAGPFLTPPAIPQQPSTAPHKWLHRSHTLQQA